MKALCCAVLAALLLGTMSIANSATFHLIATIDGAQAGTSSAATGFGDMTYDDSSGLLSWNISWSPLDGDILFAHFHGPAAPGVSAGIQVTIGGDTLVSPAIGSAIIDATQASQLLDGLWYINIHSTVAPPGEIRGQVQVIPLPGAALLLLSALGVLGLRRRS